MTHQSRISDSFKKLSVIFSLISSEFDGLSNIEQTNNLCKVATADKMSNGSKNNTACDQTRDPNSHKNKDPLNDKLVACHKNSSSENKRKVTGIDLNQDNEDALEKVLSPENLSKEELESLIADYKMKYKKYRKRMHELKEHISQQSSTSPETEKTKSIDKKTKAIDPKSQENVATEIVNEASNKMKNGDKLLDQSKGDKAAKTTSKDTQKKSKKALQNTPVTNSQTTNNKTDSLEPLVSHAQDPIKRRKQKKANSKNLGTTNQESENINEKNPHKKSKKLDKVNKEVSCNQNELTPSKTKVSSENTIHNSPDTQGNSLKLGQTHTESSNGGSTIHDSKILEKELNNKQIKTQDTESKQGKMSHKGQKIAKKQKTNEKNLPTVITTAPMKN